MLEINLLPVREARRKADLRQYFMQLLLIVILTVGGIALDPDLGALALEAAESPNNNRSPLIGIAAAVVAGVVAFGGAAWYAWRRQRRLAEA